MRKLGIGLVSFVLMLMTFTVFSPNQQLDGKKDLNQVYSAVVLSIIFAFGVALIF